MSLFGIKAKPWLLFPVPVLVLSIYVMIANWTNLSLNRQHLALSETSLNDLAILALMKKQSKDDSTSNIQPNYRGSSRICKSRSGRLDCPSRSINSLHRNECLKVSIVGLCGKWTVTLRSFPAVFACPDIANTTFIVEEAGKPESIKDSDIVIFSFVSRYMNMDVWLDLRYYRQPGQMWVFQTEESPYYAVGLLPPWMYRKDTYDISNTYRSDSDIFSPYGFYEPFRSEESNSIVNITEILENKSRFMVWISSHCETLQWDRTKFVKDLQKMVHVDIFGKCGNHSLCNARFTEECTKEADGLVSTYKFNLALENSCCEDYLTEKLWHTYSVGSVPVVMGPRRTNYEKFAPPNSFIHLDDFDSLGSLQTYLEYLDKNDTAYLEYFKWKLAGVVKEHSIREHFQNHLSDSTMCMIADHYFRRKDAKTVDKSRSFDPYGSEWKESCHSCGTSPWLRDYEYTASHKRKNKWRWA